MTRQREKKTNGDSFHCRPKWSNCDYKAPVRISAAGTPRVFLFVSCSSSTPRAQSLHPLVRVSQAEKRLVFRTVGMPLTPPPSVDLGSITGFSCKTLIEHVISRTSMLCVFPQWSCFRELTATETSNGGDVGSPPEPRDRFRPVSPLGV